MATLIPPWLNIDPIEPARIELQAKTRRAANAAAERRAQLEEQRLFAQQQMMYARLAAQERADRRREQVLRETRDSHLAQQAAALEFRRAMAMQTNERQTRQLRLREQQVEQQTAAAARQLKGMRSLQEDMKRMPLEQALAKNAADLFSGRPERGAEALRRAQPVGVPQEFTTPGGMKGVYNTRTGAPSFPPRAPAELPPEAWTAREILNQQGQPTGARGIPGKGAVRILPGQTGVNAQQQLRIILAQLGVAQNKALLGRTKQERDAAAVQRDKLEKELEALKTGAAPTQERLPGKEDERADQEGDFLLPPTGEEGEAVAEGEPGEAELMEQELEDEEEPEGPELEEEEF